MTIAVKMLNDHVRKVSETNSLLDMLLEFEKFLDDTNLYAYKNWIKGELIEGPIVQRHYVTIKLMYPKAEMPDPYGAKRLFARECMVKFTEDTLVRPMKVKSFDDVTIETRPDGSVKRRARSVSEPVWVVEIKLPRKYVDEFNTEQLEADENNYVDLESMNAETQIAQEQDMQQNDPAMNPQMSGGIDMGATI